MSSNKHFEEILIEDGLEIVKGVEEIIGEELSIEQSSHTAGFAYFRSPSFVGAYEVNWNRDVFVSMDNKKCFNKHTQNPVAFIAPVTSRRLRTRLVKAINFLRTDDGVNASAGFNFERYFDGMGFHFVASEFRRIS
jgi:hypothetical protein